MKSKGLTLLLVICLVFIGWFVSRRAGVVLTSNNSGQKPPSQLAAVATAPTSGLVGYWNFNEGSGTSALDSSGNNNTGTFTGSATWNATGKTGAAVSLNGSGYVNFGNSQTLRNPAITVSAWINPTKSTNGNTSVLSMDTGSTKAYQITWKDSGSSGFGAYTNIKNTSSTITAFSSQTLTANTWHLVTATYDNTSGVLSIYFDGVLSTTTQGSGGVSYPTFGSRSLILGMPAASVSTGFKGLVDEVRVYNRALSAQEVSDIYNDPGSDVPTPGDTTPPVISSISSSAVDSSSAVITWTTDESGDSQVEYGATSSYGSASSLNASLVTSHSISLTGLSASTVYHYRVKSTDSSSNLASSSDQTFTTSAPPAADIIAVNPNTTYQTMLGWEAVNFALNLSANFDNFISDVIDKAVNQVGINRIRQEIKSGLENTTEWVVSDTMLENDPVLRCNMYATINDNDDPDTINWDGFQYASFDNNIEKMIVPMRQALQARGEELYISLTYVAFLRQITLAGCSPSLVYDHTDPQEYAEFILAAFLHMQNKYGFVPDSVEVILEPDNNSFWRGKEIGDAIVATAQKLAANGFSPTFIATSATNMGNALTYFNTLASQAPAALPYMSEISYHRYSGVSDSNLQGIASKAVQYNLGSTMNEWWNTGNSYQVLHKDLEMGRNSSWEQGTLAGSGTITVTNVNETNPSSPVVSLTNMSKYTSHYFKYVRIGAQRIGVTPANSDYKVLAFSNTNGKQVVVGYNTVSGGSVSVTGLSAGTYGIWYSAVDGSHFNVDGSDVTISTGEALDFTLPYASVFTVYAKSLAVVPASDTTAPTISSISAGNIAEDSSTITWTTDEAGDTQVEYGLTSLYGLESTLNPSLSLSHSVDLSGLTASTIYHYRVKSADTAGNLRTSSDRTFTTNAIVDTTPPTVSSISSGSIAQDSATVTWTTNEVSDTQVEYGLTSSYGSTSSLDVSLVSSHSVDLSGLATSTTYHYRVKSRDASGNLRNSLDHTFTTLDNPAEAPIISSFFPTPSSITSGLSSLLAWVVSGTPTPTFFINQGIGLVSGNTQSVSPIVTTTYTLTAANSAGTTTDQATVEVVAPSISPPIISNPNIPKIGYSLMPISWTTDKVADSKVEYGLTTSYGSTTPVNSSLTLSHTMSIPGLRPGQTYHYRIISRDVSGNITTSEDLTFTTLPRLSKPPKIFSIRVTPGSVVLDWDLIDYDLCTNIVIYRSTSGYPTNSGSPLATIACDAITYHDSDVLPSTTYYYSLYVVDDADVYSDPLNVSYTTSADPEASVSSSSGSSYPGSSSGTPRTSIGNLSNQIIKNLSFRSEGPDVLLLQRFLVTQKFLTSDNATGFFGSVTEASLKKFQTQFGIVSSGSVETTGFGAAGPKTRGVINSLLGNTTASTATQTNTPSPTSPRAPLTGEITKRLMRKSEGAEVSLLQKILVQEGFLTGDSVTGYFGPVTEAALKKFQAAHYLVTSGTPTSTGYGATGPLTRDLLNTLVHKF